MMLVQQKTQKSGKILEKREVKQVYREVNQHLGSKKSKLTGAKTIVKKQSN